MKTVPVSARGVALVLLMLWPGTAIANSERTVTEVIEPGVERVVEDGTGRDLDRYFSSISIAPDGSVWLPAIGDGLWKLGEVGLERSDGDDRMRVHAIEFAPDGTLWIAGDLEFEHD